MADQFDSLAVFKFLLHTFPPSGLLYPGFLSQAIILCVPSLLSVSLETLVGAGIGDPSLRARTSPTSNPLGPEPDANHSLSLLCLWSWPGGLAKGREVFRDRFENEVLESLFY